MNIKYAIKKRFMIKALKSSSRKQKSGPKSTFLFAQPLILEKFGAGLIFCFFTSSKGNAS